MLNKLLPSIIANYPAVIPYLKAGFYKTYSYMLTTIQRMVYGVYNGNMGGDFVDILGSLMTGQITQAFQQALEDEGYTTFIMPWDLQTALTDQINLLVNFDYIYQYYKDIVDARVDGTSIIPLLARADLWANRYNESYNLAISILTKMHGGKLMWVEGDTVHKCSTCLALDGIVAYASEWERAGVKPQSAPNAALECDGWKCECKLVPTDKRRTRHAYDKIVAARM